MKKTWKGIHAPVENSIIAMTTSHSKTNEHKMMSMTNIIIFSAFHTLCHEILVTFFVCKKNMLLSNFFVLEIRANRVIITVIVLLYIIVNFMFCF